MKKLLIGLFALTSVAAFSSVGGANVYLKVGGDLYSRFKFSDSEGLPKKADSGYGIFLEATKEVANNTELGLGIGYIGRDGKTYTEKDEWGTLKVDMPAYDSIPLYLVAKYNFNTGTNLIPYVKADLGYSFNRNIDYKLSVNGEKVGDMTMKVKNGVYAGIGIGLEYKNFVTDLTYVHTGAKLKVTDEGGTEKEKYKNRAVRLSIGYKF